MSTNLKELNSRLSALESQQTVNTSNVKSSSSSGSGSSNSSKSPVKTATDTSETTSQHTFVDTIDQMKKSKNDEIVKKVNDTAKKQADIQGVDLKDVLRVVVFVVDFVENIASYVPEVIQLVGGLITGQVKLSIAIQLVTHLIGDISSAVGNLCVEDLVNNTVDLKYHQQRNTDGTVTSTVSQVKKSTTDVDKEVKKKTFPFAFSGRTSKKEK